MRIMVLWLSLTTMFATNFSEIAVSDLRNLYYKAAFEERAAEDLRKVLSSVDQNSAPLLQCYKGAAYMIEAKYAFNPFTKVAKFRKGKSAIEYAIKQEPKDLEMRFLRFSIQTNLPLLLGYHQHIEVDKRVLLDEVMKLNDPELKKNIVNYLLVSKRCTKEELKKIRN